MIMANVKAKSLTMTSLRREKSVHKHQAPGTRHQAPSRGYDMRFMKSTYVGTAGAILDRSLAGGLDPMWSSFSRIVFSDGTILRLAMMDRLGEVVDLI
jgi:hypothetical protein